MTTAVPAGHLTGLQSLRGLAALVVLFHHALFYFPTTPVFRFWSEVLFNAHAAVMLFFVLSGFVLVRALGQRQLTLAATATFYVKRAFRIVPAMWAAILLAALYFLTLHHLPGPVPSDWYTMVKTPSTGAEDFVKALFALPSAGVLPPLWSIRVEIGACVVIPVFAILAARGRVPISIAALALALGTLLMSFWYVGAPSYVSLFAIGAALAPWFDRFRGDDRSRAAALAALLALAVLVFFRLLSPQWRFEADFSAMFPGLVEGAASAILIGIVGARPRTLPVLTRPALVYLGDISYSIYLLHFVFMEVSAKLMGLVMPGISASHPNFAAIILTALTLLLTLPASALSYRFIERPGIEWGAAVLRAFRTRRGNQPVSGIEAQTPDR